MTSVHEQLVAARQALVDAGIDNSEAGLDAEVLARHVLGWDRAALIARWLQEAPPSFAAQLQPLVSRRALREPVAYITGRREFWGLDIEVTPDVLIPRPETELIIEQALKYAAEVRPPRRIIDVGTGSGCIAIALASEFPNALITGTDISSRALAVARRNADRLHVSPRLSLVTADLLEGLVDRADLIVANPPYIPDQELTTLQPDVARYEPHTALFGGADGLAAIRRLLASAGDHLEPGGWLIVEFGFGQDAEVEAAGRVAGWDVVRVAPDLQGIPRVAVLRR